MKRRTTPYEAQVFICVRARDGEGKSCAEGDNPELKSILKDEVNQRGWKGRARVSTTSCLGVCGVGPNIMIYPQKIWLSDVTRDDVPEIMDILAETLGE